MEKKAVRNQFDLTQGKPIKTILLFAIPLFIGNVFQQVYSIADTMVAGYCLGDEAIAAIGVTSSLYSLILNFAMGFNSGSALVLTRAVGAKDIKRIRNSIAGMIEINIFITIFLTSLVLILLNPLLKLINTPEAIFGLTKTYIAILCAGMAATVAYNMFSGILRAFGNSRTALYFLILSCILNTVLDLLLVAVFKFGIAGAALATVISQFISALLCCIYVVRNFKAYLPGKTDWKPDGKNLHELISSGAAMAIMYCTVDLGSVLYSGANNKLGELYITAHTAARKIMIIMMAPLSTISTAYSTFVGQNCGARLFDRIKSTTKKVLGIEIGWGIFAFVFIWFTGSFFIKLITGSDDQEMIKLSLFSIRFQHGFYPALGILLCLRTCMQAMGAKVPPVIASTIEMVTKVLFAFVIIPMIGFTGTVIAEPIIWCVCAVYILISYLVLREKYFS